MQKPPIEVHRYASYYRGWCQAFGEFEPGGEGEHFTWLYGEESIGLVAAEPLRRPFLKALLGREKVPGIHLAPGRLICEGLELVLDAEADRTGFERLAALLRSGLAVHMFLTSHIFFPGGTRIVTFSPSAPAVILYKRIAPMQVRLEEPR